MHIPLSLGFEEIGISQNKNLCKSRLHVNIESEVIRGIKLKIPLISANMSTVTDCHFALQMEKAGALGVLHRAAEFHVLEEHTRTMRHVMSGPVAVSVGVGHKQIELAHRLVRAGADIIVIDIAHGYCDEVIDMARYLKVHHPTLRVVVGNTVNIGLLEETADFADAVKIGIGQGFACTTKNTAGATEKQFSAVLKFKEVARQLGMPVISDGGVRESADFVKAIAAGANSVMAGSIFAACPESAAELVTINEQPKKLYAGMASSHVQHLWKGGVKTDTVAEGEVRLLDLGLPVAQLVESYAGSLRSGITYGGGTDIKSFQKNVQFVRFK